MIQEELTVEKKEKAEYEPLPENIYQVELLDVNLEQKATYDTRNKPDEEKKYEKVLNFQFTLLGGKQGDKSLRGRNVWENFVPTYLYIGKNGKNKLYEVLEGLLGRSLTQEEEAYGIDTKFLNGLIGKQVRVGIKHKTSGDRIYDRIEVYYPIDAESAPLTFDEKEKAKVKPKDQLTAETARDIIDGSAPKSPVQVDASGIEDVPVHQVFRN